MNVLVVGLGPELAERVTADLRDAGHQVLGASGRASARMLAAAVPPDLVLAPPGEEGGEVERWLDGLLDGVPVVVIEPGEDVRATVDASGSGAVSSPPAPPSGDPPPPPPPPSTSAPTTPVAPPSPLAAGAGVPASIGVRSATGARTGAALLAEKLQQVRFADYFTILEVEPTASAFVIREQAQRLTGLYSPEAWPDRLDAEGVARLHETARGLADATTVLGDTELRERYVRALTEADRRGRSTS